MQQLDVGTLFRLRDMQASGVSMQTYTVGYAAAVAARGNDVYVVDRLAGQLLGLNLALGEARVLTNLADPDTHGLYVTRDQKIYVVDKIARSVRQFDADGRLLRSFEHLDLLPTPVDVTESSWGGDLIVADGLSNRLVRFNALASVMDTIGSNMTRNSIAQSIQSIASTANSIFVLDSEMGEAMRFSLRGNQTGNYGEDNLEFPTAMAVDACGRIFIADRSGQGILVSLPDMLQSAARAEPNMPFEGEITDLWVDGSNIYVAAGAEGIRIYLVEPPCGAF